VNNLFTLGEHKAVNRLVDGIINYLSEE